MDLTVLRKKINTFRTSRGRLTKVSDELLGEILHAWENWTGPTRTFYRDLGVDYRKMGKLMGKAKKLKREGFFDGVDFKEIGVASDVESITPIPMCQDTGCGIELVWQGHIIRFRDNALLLDFLGRTHVKEKEAA